jgi:two-component system, OmpR family, response regulator
MSEGSILILEDDVDMRSMLVRGLREEGFQAESVGTGGQFLERVASGCPTVLIIDIGLPDADGRDVCQALRAQGVTTPVLFLTARDALTDRISGFKAGGDDYLTKPFAFAELVVRLEALLRRAGSEQSVDVGALRLDPRSHAAACGGMSVALTPTEFRLLGRLAAAPGEAVRRHSLIEVAWPHGAFVQENTLDAYIARLRRKLAGLPDAPAILTVRGVGYRIQ